MRIPNPFAKASKAAKIVGKEEVTKGFAPKLLKASRDGRNTVSAKRALAGAETVSTAHSKKATSGAANPLAGRGNIGGRQSREATASNIKASGSKGERIKMKDRELKAQAQSGDTDLAYHRMKSANRTRSAPIQMNGSGYSNPRLQPISKPSGTIEPTAPFSSNMPVQHNYTFDNRPNRTTAAKLLSSRMNNY